MGYVLPSVFDFPALINGLTGYEQFYAQDWLEWRQCYEGGRPFREEFLEQFNDREDTNEFLRRKSLTPIPAFAKKEVNAVKNSLAQRFPDIIRRNGSKVWQDAVAGNGRGVDLRGSSMNSFLSRWVVPDLLVIGKVGVLLDAPRVNGSTAADVPRNFRPYLNMYHRERYSRLVPAPTDSPSDWQTVLLHDNRFEVDKANGEITEVRSYRWYYLDSARGNLVTIQELDEEGQETGPPIRTDLDSIPFVQGDIGISLMADVCSYQVSMLNMMSADSNYAIDSNYPLMVRQRGNAEAGAYLIGDDDEVEAGRNKGIFYDKGLDAPSFINPASEPMQSSLELRREMKKEIHELVTGAVIDVGEGSMEAGLAYIGGCVAHLERRLWDHWEAVMSTDARRRNQPIVIYPDSWNLKTDKERVEEAKELLDLMNELPGRLGKQHAAKMAYDKLARGKVSTTELDAMKAEVDAAPYATADPDIIDMAVERGLCDSETGSLALGFDEGIAKKAQEERAERAAIVVAAQTDAAAGAGMGAPDLSVNDDSVSQSREGQPTRGEGEDTQEDGEDE